uniref:PfkB family carbohydrate kinase n=1 Tax=Fodinicola feengrottensis TaxID=435914 RepID=UPI0036F41238
MTLGSQGALWADRDGVVRRVAQPAAVVDTTGAGDAFTAGLLAAILRKKSRAPKPSTPAAPPRPAASATLAPGRAAEFTGYVRKRTWLSAWSAVKVMEANAAMCGGQGCDPEEFPAGRSWACWWRRSPYQPARARPRHPAAGWARGQPRRTPATRA